MSEQRQIVLGDAPHALDFEGDELLCDALRRRAKQASVLKWCRDGRCGACRVLVDGALVLSCRTTVASLREGAVVQTKESLQHRPWVARALQLFDDERPSRCKLCVGAMAVTAAWLEDSHADGDTLERSLVELRCSCTGRASLRRALQG